ncbi:MAG: nitrile hydratase accessory protein [Solirubrobacteraceae bacterium]
MSDLARLALAEEEGPAAVPRRNGELVFDAPWESRAFAIAVGLSGELYDWEDFRAELIERIASWEADPESSAEDWSYYDRWLASLEAMLLERGAISRAELAQRVEQMAEAAAHEHDDEHPHDHAH